MSLRQTYSVTLYRGGKALHLTNTSGAPLYAVPSNVGPRTMPNYEALAQQGIEPMAHDFFTPQPVHGAKAYYLKMCLHDWPNPQCIQILSQLKPALKPGYSRILLDDIVIPEEKAGWFETSLDLLMMQVHSAQERREREWMGLVDGVGGLRVRRIWDLEGAVDKIIEIEAV